jgi:hypothetical protein
VPDAKRTPLRRVRGGSGGPLSRRALLGSTQHTWQTSWLHFDPSPGGSFFCNLADMLSRDSVTRRNSTLPIPGHALSLLFVSNFRGIFQSH